MPKSTVLTKCAEFLYLSTKNLAREAYSGQLGVGSAPPPLQEKFLDMPMDCA